MFRKTISILLFCILFLSACSPGNLGPIETGQVVPTQDTQVGEGTAIVWERSGGIAGICQRLTIEYHGAYRLVDCRDDHTFSEGELTSEQFEELSAALERFGSFTWEFMPPAGSADMFQDQYIFNGRGSQQPTSEMQEQINLALAALSGELLANPPDPSAPGSGIEGQSLIGPVCPVQQVDGSATPCPDHQPYQATITVFDAQNNSVSSFQTGADGSFKVSLEPGDYTLGPESPPNSPYPRAEKLDVTVTEGEFTPVEIRFDSGIR